MKPDEKPVKDPLQSVVQGNHYEFTSEQNAFLMKLVSKMRWFGIAVIILGAFQVVIHVFFKVNFLNVMYGLFILLVGTLTVEVSHYFRKIVKTEGSDLDHLMNALRHLYKVYNIQYWIALTGLVSVGVTLILMYIFDLSLAEMVE